MAKYDFDIARFVGASDKSKANAFAEDKTEREIIEAAQAGNKDAVNYLFLKSGKFIFNAFKTYTGPVTEYFRRAVQNGDYEMFVAECYAMLKDPEKTPLATFDCSKYEDLDDDMLRHFGFYYLQYAKALAKRIKTKDDRMGITGNIPKDDKVSRISLDYTNDNKDDSDHAGNNKFEDYVLDAAEKNSGNAYSMEDEVLNRMEAEDDEFMGPFKDCLTDKAWEKKDGALKKVVTAFVAHPELGIDEAVKVSGLVSDEEAAEKRAKGITDYWIYHDKASTFKRYLQVVLPDLFNKYGVDLQQFLTKISSGNTSDILRALGSSPVMNESKRRFTENSIFYILGAK